MENLSLSIKFENNLFDDLETSYNMKIFIYIYMKTHTKYNKEDESQTVPT